MHRPAFTLSQGHRGISLIVVLILMVCLSLIGAVGMRQVMTGERANANERDRALALQASESAARDTINQIGTLTGTGVYAFPINGGGNADYWRTTSSLSVATACPTSTTAYDTTKRFNWDNCSGGVTATSKYGNKTAPQYVIEKMPVDASGQQWYRVTTRAVGGSGQADVILQVMVSR